MSLLYLAIDPGEGGGFIFGVANGSPPWGCAWKSRAETIDLLRVTPPDIAVIEKIPLTTYRPKGGPQRIPEAHIAKLHSNYGWWCGFMQGADIPLVQVAPRTYLPATPKGASYAERKRRYRDLAIEQYPNARPRPTLKTADAFLLFSYTLKHAKPETP